MSSVFWLGGLEVAVVITLAPSQFWEQHILSKVWILKNISTIIFWNFVNLYFPTVATDVFLLQITVLIFFLKLRYGLFLKVWVSEPSLVTVNISRQDSFFDIAVHLLGIILLIWFELWEMWPYKNIFGFVFHKSNDTPRFLPEGARKCSCFWYAFDFNFSLENKL